MIDAMKQALRVLERINGYGDVFLYRQVDGSPHDQVRAVITALRAAIEAAERAEPVAYVNNDGFIVEVDDIGIVEGTKLYAHPPAVTDEMVERAAKTLADLNYPVSGWPSGFDAAFQEHFRKHARAALEAALGAKHAES